MKIILANNKEYNPIMVTGAKRTINGATRDCLSFVFDNSFSLDELDAAFTPEACESITIVGDDNSEAVHSAYTIRAEIKKYSEVAEAETPNKEAVTVERVIVAMAQRTYQETKMAELEARLNTLTV